MRPSSSTLRIGAADFADDPPLVEADDAIREGKNLVERFGNQQNRAASVAKRGEQAMNEGCPGDIDASRRLRRDKQLRLALEFARDGEALLIAAGEAPGRVAERAETHGKPHERLPGLGVDRPRAAAVQNAKTSAPARVRPTKLSRTEAVRHSPSSPRSALM